MYPLCSCSKCIGDSYSGAVGKIKGAIGKFKGSTGNFSGAIESYNGSVGANTPLYIV